MPSMSDVDAAFAEVAERRAEQAAEAQGRRQLWLAHHWPHRYERCATIAGRKVCRRCLWFYGVAFSVLGALGFGASLWPTAWEPVILWLLALPATIEFVGGERGWWGYGPRRQIVVSALMGVAVGRGFHIELRDPGSWHFWGPVLVYGSIWFSAATNAWFAGRGQYR